MVLTLLNGICKEALFPSDRQRNRQYAAWGGTTADVGYRPNIPLALSLGGWTAAGSLAKRTLGLSSRAASRVGAPIGGGLEAVYGLTLGARKARSKGQEYGRILGRTNRFLAARL